MITEKEARKQIREIEYYDPDYMGGKNRIGYKCGCNKTWMFKIDAIRCLMSGHNYNRLLREV